METTLKKGEKLGGKTQKEFLINWVSRKENDGAT